MEITDKNIVKRAVFRRPDDSNKGSCGTLLSICGSYGMAGAAVMAGRAAFRCGLGLLKAAVPKSIYQIAAQSVAEAVYFPLNETDSGAISRDCTGFLLEQAEKSKAVLIGCGLSVCDDTKYITREFILNCSKPMIIDADALNCICSETEILKKAAAEVIVTPHPGEMSRLVGKSIARINSEREKTAAEFSREYGVVCVLKGAGTVIASPRGKVLINHTGNSGMACAGSGDVLSGMISSIKAQGASAFDAAASGVYLHGLAGDIAAEKFGKISMLPTDTVECIHRAFEVCGLNQ